MYDLFIGPHAIEKGLRILAAENVINHKRSEYHSWAEYIQPLNEELLDKARGKVQRLSHTTRWLEGLYVWRILACLCGEKLISINNAHFH